MSEGLPKGMNPNELGDVEDELNRATWEKDWEPGEEEKKDKVPNPESLEEAA
ncbi:MAG: hypothetical protein HYY51_02810 [Candidatus Magasanikbacteria bacterium]|nr:hypothetical protein [Candidatus Magasanikbacteria bacterium]